MNDKKKLLILVIALLLIIGSIFILLFLNNSDNNIVNNIEDDIIGKEEVNTDNFVSITLNDDEYLWKMQVTNHDGAIVYEKNKFSAISKLDYGTEISVLGDYVSQSVFQENDIDYDNFTLSEIENHYYFLISYSIANGQSEIGYINYNDVGLIDGSNYFLNEYNENKKYYVSSNKTYLYEGPGLLFERNSLSVVFLGELLSVKYYNQILSRNWLYITYENYSGWVMQCQYNPVNDPYNSIVVNDCVDEVISENGTLNINQDNVFLYKDISFEEKIDEIVDGSELTYDYKLVEPGIVKYHTNYNGKDGFVIAVDVNEEDCEQANDGKLYIIMQSDGSFETCK